MFVRHSFSFNMANDKDDEACLKADSDNEADDDEPDEPVVVVRMDEKVEDSLGCLAVAAAAVLVFVVATLLATMVLTLLMLLQL